MADPDPASEALIRQLHRELNGLTRRASRHSAGKGGPPELNPRGHAHGKPGSGRGGADRGGASSTSSSSSDDEDEEGEDAEEQQEDDALNSRPASDSDPGSHDGAARGARQHQHHQHHQHQHRDKQHRPAHAKVKRERGSGPSVRLPTPRATCGTRTGVRRCSSRAPW